MTHSPHAKAWGFLQGTPKVLSCKQPWPSMILDFEKDKETRPRNTKHRGPFVLHASKQVDSEAMEHYGKENLPTGALLGIVNLESVTTYTTPHEWDRDFDAHKCWWTPEMSEIPELNEFPKYGYLIGKDRIKFENPVSWKGQLGFWSIDAKIIQKALKAPIPPSPKDKGILGERL